MFFGLFKSKKKTKESPEEKKEIIAEKQAKKSVQNHEAYKVEELLVKQPAKQPPKEIPEQSPEQKVEKLSEQPSERLPEQPPKQPTRSSFAPPELPISKSFLIGSFIKIIVFCLVGAALVVGNFFLEVSFVSGEEIREKEFTAFDDSQENFIPDRGVIRFADEAEYGFANSMDVESIFDNNEYIFNLNSAKFWANFTISNAKVNIVVDKAVIIPDHAAFDLEFDGSRIILAVHDGDVYIGFLDEGIALSEYVDKYNNLFVNKLLVPRGTQVNIPLSKLDERLKSLLYSKLVKEFKYSAIPSSLKESDWVIGNLSKDKKYIESVKQTAVSDIIFKGSLVSDTKIGNFIFWAEENLTFIPEKKHEMVFDHLFSYLNDAIFYANEGDEDASNSSWGDFNGYLAILPASISESDEYFERFDKYLGELSIFGPGDEQYGILQKMLEKKKKKDVYDVVNAFWLDVYEGLNLSGVAAEDALDRYYDCFDSTLGDIKDIEFYRDYITYYNQLFDNLFLRYPVFYKDGYFAMKNVLEQELSGLYESGQLKEELTQAFISNKINFLKRLRKFFFEGEIATVAEVKNILSRLVEDIDDLMPADDSGVAVIELFETQLEDIGDFYGYLTSPEYHMSKTYGATHEERYQSYLEEKDMIWSFINIQEEVLGETVQEISVEDVRKEINAVFVANQSVSDFEVGEIEDVAQRYVSVKGVIGGYPFEVLYDRDQGSLKDVYTYGELISDRPVKLDNLLELLKDKFAEFVVVESGEEEFTEETFAQRAARLYLSETIAEFGFVIEMENVSVVDELNAIYRVEDIHLEEYEDILVTFDFMMNGEKAINVYLSIKGEPLVMDGKFTLEELANMVIAEGAFDITESVSSGVLR